MGERILLLVEDNEYDADALIEILTSMGVADRIEHVWDGESALRRMREKAYALVLLDLSLPKIGGLEVLRMCSLDQSVYWSPKVVFTSSYHEEACREAHSYGVNCFLVKPTHFPEFKQVAQAVFTLFLDHNKTP